MTSPHKNFHLVGQTGADCVRYVTVTAPGSSYETTPEVAFEAAPAGGRTAKGYAVMVANAVDSIVVTDGGMGYLSAPTVSFSGGGGSGAAGTALIDRGSLGVVDVTMHTNGMFTCVITLNGVPRTYTYQGTDSTINKILQTMLSGPGGLNEERLFGAREY